MKWINVADKLPDHKDLVLFSDKYGKVLPAIFYNNQSFKGFYKFTTFYSFICIQNAIYNNVGYEQFSDVTHWMPLPNPPKEEGEK